MANSLSVAGSNSKYKRTGTKPAGFWGGLWHGIIAPITFLVSLFVSGVSIYETNNNGRWYRQVKWTIPAVLLLLLVPFCLAADKKEEKPKPAQSIDELRQQIEKILMDTHTNGVSVAIVHKSGPEWVTGLGRSEEH